jgi:hypothetical protein
VLIMGKEDYKTENRTMKKNCRIEVRTGCHEQNSLGVPFLGPGGPKLVPVRVLAKS